MEQKQKTGSVPVVHTEKACDAYCPICRKLLHLEPGQAIPRCCGKPMQILN